MHLLEKVVIGRVSKIKAFKEYQCCYSESDTVFRPH